MDTLLHNKWSASGMLFGAISLLIVTFHFTFGPFNPPPKLDHIVAEQVSALKRGIIAGLRGQEPKSVPPEKRPVNLDGLLTGGSIGMAILALFTAFIGGLRKENAWCRNGALLFGGATLALHALLLGMTLVTCLIVLLSILTVVAFFLG